MVVRAFAHGACVVGSILHGGPTELFLHERCNKGCGMCYPVCGMVNVKDPLLLIGKSSQCSGEEDFLSRYLSGPLPYVRRHITVNQCVECIVK